MNKDVMYSKLYNDYQIIYHEWEQALDDLDGQLRALDDAHRQKAEATETLELYEQAVILGETNKEGRVNGSNAETRKTQTQLLLADLHENDPNCQAFAEAAELADLRVAELRRNIEMLRQKISLLYSQSKMVSGLAYALAG